MTNSRRVAIVTGAARGIGRGIALRLARDGFNVVVNDIVSTTESRETIKDIEALPPSLSSKNQEPVRAIAIQGDAGNITDGKRLLDETIRAFGRLDIVVCNAAWVGTGSIRDLDEDLFAKAIDTNIKGPLFFSKLAQPYLEKAQKQADAVKDGGSPLGGSRIINISSMVTSMSEPQPEYLLYGLTKGALDQVTRLLARDQDFGGKGITVNGISPAAVDTDALRKLPEAALQAIKANAPQKRFGEVEDIADVVSFLAGHESRWVNGQTIGVNGGVVV
ncbi:hypothetical protein EC968_007558 [Mortierella alpina]|nr:hypothetical protein EC968_007558 [Mortierella alpina]